MKKSKKSRKPKLPRIIKRPVKGVGNLAGKGARRLTGKDGRSTEQVISEALSNVPRITNETVEDHREDVLSKGRKHIYPLQHSKHRIVRISLSLFALVIVAFFIICAVSLYKFQNTSGFIYGVTKIIPFP